MAAQFDNSQIRFQYPEGWELDETRSADGYTVSLQSPGSMFFFLTVYEQGVPPDDLAEQALNTMLEEYPELDSAPVTDTIASLPAVGHDINFFSLDLTNTCWIRAFASQSATVLLFAQVNDLELDAGEQVFQSVCKSLELADGHGM